MKYNTIKAYILERTVKWIVGGELFDQVKNLVLAYASENIPGDEKRKKVLEQVKLIRGNISNFVVNLVIETAVFIIKTYGDKFLNTEK